jgi:hypothetical protein
MKRKFFVQTINVTEVAHIRKNKIGLKSLTGKRVLTFFAFFFFMANIFSFYSCEKSGDGDFDIPSDSYAEPNPVLSFTNITIPNPKFSMESGNIVRVEMTGIMSPKTGQWLDFGDTRASSTLRAAVESLPASMYIEHNGQPKGVGVSFADNSKAPKLFDYIFLVDNSGSMADEANAVANEIADYARYLVQQGLDVRFGCVGYADYGDISGAINLTGSAEINAYLNRNGIVGTSRTKGFSGTDANTLSAAASQYASLASGECGSVALKYADNILSFRNGAQRIYVNFTDEPNQPKYKEYGIELTKPENWGYGKGTVHTVFSADTIPWYSSYEKPWLMSDYTGGTKLFTDEYFTTTKSSFRASSGGEPVSLITLPVTGAILYSYIIRFRNTSKVADGQHEVKFTVQSLDGSVQGERTFRNVSFSDATF